MAGEVVDVLLRARMETGEVTGEVGKIQKALQGLTLPKNISSDLEKSFGKLGPLLKDYQKQLDKGFSTQKDLKSFNLLREKIGDTFNEIKSKIQEVNGQEVRVKTDLSAITKMEKELDDMTAKMQKHMDGIYRKGIGQSQSSITQDLKNLQAAIPANFTALSKEAQKLTSAFNGQNFASFNRQIDQMYNHVSKLSGTSQMNLADKLGLKYISGDASSAEKALGKFFSQLQVNKTNANAIERINQQIKELVPNIEQAKMDSITNGLQQLEGASGGIDKVADDMYRIGAASEEAGSGILSMKSQVEQLKTSTQYFFSLRNMLNLLKRGVDDAVQSIKELDKAMTDTAVVTDFTVGDMWKDLPKYTQLANELGATTQGAYETMTLYYQQGLNQEQAFALGAETMKMARIAGLDYAETTDMMTAALRGFNMELDEASAKRVNDVYSKLAAITASDTEELGTAMQRTASIAHSAGMSFEGTTAFLAQAIETTREPAENLGTAMKTIVARFQEMKENPLEITEVDGEEVSYNKVDKALQSIGVSLKDTNGQFRELDQVFLDISQRWDSLTQTQQRYIATTAAGSRQQSRFIAMMDNYERTVQLFSAANDSAGASDEQFGKTADSLEFKLNKLHNAWQQFTMSIMNDSWTKGFVSAGTTVLNIVNDIINKLSFDGQNKGIKSLLSVITAFTALKTGGRLVNSLIGGLGGLVDPTSSVKEGFKGGFLGGRNQLQAERISNPIVKAIYNLIPHIDKAAMPEGQYKFQDRGNFNKAYSDINKMLSPIKGVDGKVPEGGGKYSFNQLTNIIDENKLDKAQQKLLFRATPGLKKSVINNLSNLFKNAALSPEVGKGLIQGFKSGNLALDEILTRKEFTQSTLERAKELGGESGKQYKEQFVQQAISKGKQQGLAGKELGQFVNQQLKKPISEGLGDTIQQLTSLQKVQNAIGNIGGGLITAGSSLQMFGAQLAQTNPILGQFVSGLGNAFTSIGSLATALPALMNPATLAIGAVAAAFAIDKFKTDKIKKAAEEIDTSFKDTSKTTQDNIANLKAYREELATLSKGVDQNGNNINLSDADYSRYLEIVDSIAEMNPKIVQGYNAQGHAIINNNEALEQTLSLQKQIQKNATEEYLNPDSLQALVNARNVNKDYKASTTSYSGSYKTGVTPLTDNVISVAKELKKSGFDEAQLEAFGIHSLDSLIKGEEQAVRNFVANQDKISSLVSTQLTDGMGAALTKSFDNLSTQTDAYEESIKPVYEWLSTSVSQQPLFEELPEQVRPALQKGLQAIAGDTKLTAKQMTAESNKLLSNFKNLTVGNKKYTESLKTVERAQEDYADSLNETQYKTDVQPAIDELNRLKESAENMGTAAGDAVAEYLQNQIAQISRFTEEGSISITEALNGAIDDIAAAENALEEFNKATEKDFWTASEGMRSIYDKMFETYKDSYGTEYEKHTEGEGDNTFWEGARVLLSEDKLTGGVDEVGKRVKKLEPILREGQEGVEAFYDKVVGSKEIQKLRDKGLIELDKDGWFKNIPEEQWANVAKELGISENLLTAMLNKARQFGLISFDNLGKVREALATDNRAIEGLSSTKGKKDLYIKEDTLRAELAEAGYNSTESQDKKIAELQKEQGVKTVQTLDKLDKTMAKDFAKEWGISNLPDLITKMAETGEYNKEEILDFAEKAGLGEGEAASETYDEVVQSLESPELAEQTSELRSANSKLAAIQALIANGNDPNKVYEEGKKAQEETHNTLFGEEGTRDTQADWFRHGRDTDGNLLSAGDYASLKQGYEETHQTLLDNAAAYQELAKLSGENGEGRFTSLAKQALADAEQLQEYIDYSGKAWERGNRVKEQEIEAENQAREERVKNEEEALKNKEISGKEYQDARDAGREQEREVQAAAQGQVGLAQTYLNNLNESFSSLFGNLDPSIIANNPQALSAAEVLSKTVAGEITPTPEDINTALGTLGIEQGSFAYDKFLQFATEKANQINNGAEDAVSNATPTEGSESFNSTVNTKVGDWIKGLFKEPEVPNIDPKTDSGFREKVQSQIKNWLNNLFKTPEVPNAPSQPQQPQGTQQPQAAPTFSPAELKVETGDSIPKIQEIQTEGQKAVDTVNTTAVFDVTVPGSEKLKSAAKYADKIKGVKGNTSIGVSAKVDGTKDINSFNKAANKAQGLSSKSVKYTAKVSGTADTNAGAAAGERFQSLYNKTVTYTTKYKTEGSPGKPPSTGGFITTGGVLYRAKGGSAEWPGYPKKGTDRIRAYLTPGEYVQNRKAVQYFGIDFMRHINHRDLSGALQSFGSAAKGTKSRYGQVGPRGKGGMTLTGELGYEIAWIPSENRSMILGANGPQMVDLPSDAVVWTHEQSKKILQRQTIPAGSHSTPASGSSLNFERRYANNNTTVTHYDSKNNNRIKNATNTVTETAVKVGKVSVWWENIARLTEAAQRKADAAYSEFQKFIKRMDATLTTTGTKGKGNDYITNLEKVISFNTKQSNRAGSALNTLDKSKKKTKIKYKQGKKTKSKKFALGDFIDYNAELDTYTINQKKLNNVAKKKGKGGTNAAKAIKEQAEKKINDNLAKRNKAEDEIRKAQEALEKFGEELYKNFFAWENELTKIWNITQQIAETEARINRIKEYSQLLDTQVKSGQINPNISSIEQILNTFKLETQQSVQALQQKGASINQQQIDLERLISTEDEQTTLNNIQSKINSGKLSPTEEAGYKEYYNQLANSIIAQNKARSLTNITRLTDGTVQVDFNDEEFKRQKDAGNIGAAEAEEIQKWVKEVTESSKKISDTYSEITTGLTEFYDKLEDLRQQWVDYEKELLNGLEESNSQRTEELSKLSRNISDALKKLLDEVKRKLDERRKQEENAKTERDISQKQQQLAMLQADTSGGHAVEIAKLQQEITNAQNDYQKSLEDQLLEKLQQQADLAAEQRERLIELSEDQIKATNNAALVAEWMAEPDKYEKEIKETYLKGKGYEDAGIAERELLVSQADEFWKDVKTNAEKKAETQKAINTLSSGTIELSNGQQIEGGLVGLVQHGITAQAEQQQQVIEQISANTEAQRNATQTVTTVKQTQQTQTDYWAAMASVKRKKPSKVTKGDINNLYNLGSKLKIGKKQVLSTLVGGKGADPFTWYNIMKPILGSDGINRWNLIKTYGENSEASKAVQKYFGKTLKQLQNEKKWKSAKAFKSGGLADFTGPAWLDGTTSKPELVLNAQDTKNFIALKDVLSRAMGATSNLGENYGDINYEININVEKLTSDYDVDKVADRVKKIIVKDSSYRNVTQVRKFR